MWTLANSGALRATISYKNERPDGFVHPAAIRFGVLPGSEELIWKRFTLSDLYFHGGRLAIM